MVKLCNEKLEINIHEGDIEVAHRLKENVNGKPRSVIVRFARRCVRNEVVKRRSSLKGTKVVIADDLCPTNMSIFHEMREKLGYRNVWTI